MSSFGNLDELASKLLRAAINLLPEDKIQVRASRKSWDLSATGLFLGLAGAYVTYKTGRNLWRYYLRPAPKLRLRYERSWAVITGATGGIGLHIAHELAASGISIVLLARNKQRLNETADELRQRYVGIEVRTISFDAEFDTNFDTISFELQDIPISLLFNNVGVHNDLPTPVSEMSYNDIRRIVDVNCTFQAQMVALVTPQMKLFVQNNHGQRRAMIVNVSSLLSQIPFPYLAVYAASKAFEEHLTSCIQAELSPQGIDVMCMRPGLTVSAMSGQTNPSFGCPSAETMARACLYMLNCGESSIVPYFPHAINDWMNSLMPASLTGVIVRGMQQQKREDMLRQRGGGGGGEGGDASAGFSNKTAQQNNNFPALLPPPSSSSSTSTRQARAGTADGGGTYVEPFSSAKSPAGNAGNYNSNFENSYAFSNKTSASPTPPPTKPAKNMFGY